MRNGFETANLPQKPTTSRKVSLRSLPWLATTRLTFVLIWVLASFKSETIAVAGLGPETCVLVVNSESESSRHIANVYIQLRQIPPNNVIHLKGIPATEKTSSDQFRELILKPVLEELTKRKLDRQIDCVIYSTGFPTAVNFGKFMAKLDRKPQQIETPQASLTSMTYFFRHALAESPGLISLEANAYARRSAEVVLNVPFVSKDSMDRFNAAKKLYEEKKWSEASREFGELLKEQPYQNGLAYWQCRALTQEGKKAEATKSMMEAIKRGWDFKEFAESDSELADLQDFVPFKTALKAIDEPFWSLAGPVAFNSRMTWGPNGLPERLDDSGNAYLLCCMLGVSSGATAKVNTDEEIISYLKRSVNADYSDPQGEFFFADHKDVRSTTRKPNFAAAEKALKALGFKSKVITDRQPPAGSEVLGATIGSAKFDWSKSGKFQPGAIGDNLTSFGARFDEKNGQTTIAEFMKFGAAGASGTVVEPYAIQHKFPHPLIHAYYARGFSLVESFYLSLAGPFQTLVVGDPMCQPFAKIAKLKVEGATENAEVKDRLALTIKLDQKEMKAGAIEFFFDGVRIGSLKSSSFSLDTTKHADGFHELRFVTIADDKTRAQSRAILPLVFNNQNHRCEATTSEVNGSWQIEASATGAESIAIVSQGVEIGGIVGEKGAVSIPESLLGKGPVEYQAIAKFGNQQVATAPKSLRSK